MLRQIIEYIIMACSVYSLIMLIISIKLKTDNVIAWLSISMFVLSVFIYLGLFEDIDTIEFIRINLRWQHIVIHLALFPMAVVLKKVGINKKILAAGCVYMGAMILLIGQSFVSGFDILFRIDGNMVKTGAWYPVLYFGGSAVLYVSIIIALFLRFRKESNKIMKKLIKTLFTGICFLVLFGAVDMIYFMLAGLDGHHPVPLSLPGIIIMSVTSFVFITEVIIHTLNRNHKKTLFLQEVKIERPKDEKFRKIIARIKKEQLYLDPEITLVDLADSLGLTRNQLSRIINMNTRNNFNHFINTFRIEAFCESFINENSNEVSILELAYRCGFNSKTTFNRIFKEYYNMSPREYRQSVLNDNSN